MGAVGERAASRRQRGFDARPEIHNVSPGPSGRRRAEGYVIEQVAGTMGLVWRNDQAAKVASEYLSGLGRRWDHVRAVGRLADALAAAARISGDVAAAAWLHDLGYAEELSTTGFHPLDGATFLMSEGAPAEVVGLVAHHTGAAFEAEERGVSEHLAEMPAADPDELDILTLLDLVIAPDGTVTDPETRIAEILSRYPSSSPVHRAVSRSRAKLLASAERARQQLGLPDEWPAGAAERVLKS